MTSLPRSSMGRKQRNKQRRITALLVGVVLLSAAMSLCLGPVSVPLADVVSVMLGKQTGTVAARIVLYSRLPRTLGCLLTGAALAVAGAVIQSVLANPLAAPNVIGVNTGAGLAVTALSALVPGAAALAPVAAFVGALAGVLVVLLIGERTGASRLTLVLAGIAVSAVFSGAVDLIVTLEPDALSAYADFRIGGFSSVTMGKVGPAAGVIAAGLAGVLLLTPQMDLLALGADTARSLGLRVRPARVLLLTGAAVSIAGLLGFVGLIVPHGARKAAGGESLPLVTLSALGGAAFVTLCDLLARTLFAPYELPVGVVLSFLGGPFFLWLILRQRGGGTRA